MMSTYEIRRDPANPREAIGCIDLCASEHDGGWYAMEYDFTRKDNATRVSRGVYPTKSALERALVSGKHRWSKWD
jgi:hypothetical protein